MIELPVAVGTKSHQIVQGVHHRDRGIERERRQATFVTDFNVFVIPAPRAPVRKRREVGASSALPQASVPAGRMVGSVGHGTDRLRSVERSVGPVFGTIPVPSRDG